jgi:hypothetical protein
LSNVTLDGKVLTNWRTYLNFLPTYQTQITKENHINKLPSFIENFDKILSKKVIKKANLK